MNKVPNNKAWWLVLPMFLLVAFSAIIPLMTVVNYSLQDIFDQNTAYFVGVEWYQEVLRDTRLHDSLLRQFGFSFSVLLIEIPLGIAVALMMPTRGWQASAVLILLALPLLIPWNVVGTIWQVFARGDIGLFGWTLNNLGVDYNYTSNPLDAWLTVLLMDVWHWTSLVALLCYSGLRAIPDAYYQAAKIDRASRWAVFRYIQLPRLKNVLVIGVLLRFMDSFMIYTEPFVLTGGGPGNSTTFLSQTLTQMAIGQFDIGPAAAFSLVYFLIVLLVSWLFFTTITHMEKSDSGIKYDK
jgi:glycerol transport system permease protein